MKWPRKKSLKKFKETIREKTKRTSGDSQTRIIERVNETVRGWFEYYKHSHWNTFKPLDGWILIRREAYSANVWV